MQKINEDVKIQENITAKFYDQTTLSWARKQINNLLNYLEKFDLLSRVNFQKFYQLGRLTRTDEHHNVICNAGFNAVIKRLTGVTTYTGIINKALLGTGVGSAAASDTQLITEAYRNNIASGTDVSNVCYLTAYFTEAECSGTYKEFGNCIDGGVGANTGQLWSHLAGLNWVKNNTTVLVVSCKYTFVSA